MLTRDKIIEKANQKGPITAKELSLDFSVSRQYVNQLISQLIQDNQLIKIGKTRAVTYVTAEYAKQHPDVIPNSFSKRYKNENLEEHKVLMDIQEQFQRLKGLPENIQSIFTFAFSEMFNNAIEHSKSRSINIDIALNEETLSFTIDDSGIGVFRNIMKKKQLPSEIYAIQDLLKGKTTTMPKSHSGEGIFFTSKSADYFLLDSFNYQLVVTNDDVYAKTDRTNKRGTRVLFVISVKSKLHLNDVFRKYTDSLDNGNYGFDKTEIRVKLYTMGGVHISRSQARRITSGLDKFRVIMFDYENVPMVGQAFADEIYRVFQNSHPDIKLQEENMTEGVKFMVERAKNEARKSNQ